MKGQRSSAGKVLREGVMGHTFRLPFRLVVHSQSRLVITRRLQWFLMVVRLIRVAFCSGGQVWKVK